MLQTGLKTLSLGTEEGEKQIHFRLRCAGPLKRMLLFFHHSSGQLFYPVNDNLTHVPFQFLVNIICCLFFLTCWTCKQVIKQAVNQTVIKLCLWTQCVCVKLCCVCVCDQAVLCVCFWSSCVVFVNCDQTVIKCDYQAVTTLLRVELTTFSIVLAIFFLSMSCSVFPVSIF